MPILLQVTVSGDLYECLVKDNVIVRITKYLKNGHQIDLSFNSLPDKVKWSLVDAYNKRNEPDNET